MRFAYDVSYRDALQLLRYRADWASYALLAAALVALPWILPPFLVGEAAYLCIMVVASLGLMVLTGYTGQVSLGQGAFLAIGAYIHAWCLGKGLAWPLSFACAGIGSAAAGWLIGQPAIRVHGLYLAMVTLAFSVVVEHVTGHWKTVTGGFNGLAVPDPVVFGLPLGALKPFYYLCLAVAALVLMLLINLMRGPLGRAFVSVRDSEAAAYGLGVRVARVKVQAFALSAAVTGLAGALFAHHLKFLTPDAFGLLLSLELVLVVVIGGLGSLRGAVLGAVAISLLPTFISALKPWLPERIARQSGLELFVFGAVLAAFVLFEPTGLNGRWRKLRTILQEFPLVRRDVFRPVKTYLKSERYR
jgi:branched-chain amino acid transport system permease protein